MSKSRERRHRTHGHMGAVPPFAWFSPFWQDIDWLRKIVDWLCLSVVVYVHSCVGRYHREVAPTALVQALAGANGMCQMLPNLFLGNEPTLHLPLLGLEKKEWNGTEKEWWDNCLVYHSAVHSCFCFFPVPFFCFQPVEKKEQWGIVSRTSLSQVSIRQYSISVIVRPPFRTRF